MELDIRESAVNACRMSFDLQEQIRFQGDLDSTRAAVRPSVHRKASVSGYREHGKQLPSYSPSDIIYEDFLP